MSVNFVDGNIFSRLSTNKTTYICQQVNCNQEVLVEPKLDVVNLFGQNGYSRGERQTNYAALAAALFSFFRDCAQKYQDVTIRLPYGLGCGLAGGDWNTVLDIISDAAKAWNLNVEIWELQK